MDLVDYCARKITMLNAWEHEDAEPKSAQDLLNMTEKDVGVAQLAPLAMYSSDE